jgi:DNA-binding IclR family transcriptional regulator
MTSRGSGTVRKALGVLDVFLEGQDSLTLTELSGRTKIHKSTLLRLCQSMQQAGFLTRGRLMGFQLGPKIWQLAQIYQRQFHMEDAVRPRLRELRDRTGESASFYVREGEVRICLYRESSKHAIRHHVEQGARLPLTSGVVGRVLLAFSGARGDEFSKIRQRGYLIDRGREPFTASVAVPVLSGDGVMAGALVVSGPESRFNSKQHRAALELMLEVARDLGQQFPK